MKSVTFASGIHDISLPDVLGRDTEIQDNGSEVVVVFRKDDGSIEASRRYTKDEFSKFAKLFH